ncbi:hypothetical protein AZ66_16145 [Paenibacillus sp. E194]|uniref:type II CAAX endopeptidase family protein n=1 Tax=Paenibacillus sp. E194 TaxID=1458845 RepID=UPI0005C94069|nr:type II CAAX endopeptidase family protein [Paenibacillus sp. E194]KJB86904.1 hypothetical protein AZ66_16145 [Paenibacillus sp. E194]
MPQRIHALHASWLFLVSYVLSNILSTFIFPDKQPLYANLGLFLLYVMFAQIGLHVLPSVLFIGSKRMSWKAVFKLRHVSLSSMLLSLLIYGISQVPMLFIHQVTELISNVLGRSYQMSYYPLAADFTSLLFLIMAIGIIPPICEELLFRGVLLTGYEEKGKWFAAAMSALLFALFHDNPYRLLELFFSAWVSAIIVLHARSIWPGIVIHLATNTTYVIGSYMKGGDLVMGVTSTEAPPNYWIIGGWGALSVPAVYLGYMLLRIIAKKEQSKESHNSTSQMDSRKGYSWLIPIFLSLLIFVLQVM